MSNAVLSDPVTRTFGSVTITASLPVDGGYAINTFVGPERVSALSFTTADRDTYRAAYALIREGGRRRMHSDDIAAALVAKLTDMLHEVQRRRDTPSRARANELNDVLDRLTGPQDAARLADIAQTISRPQTFRELRDAYARDIRNQRAGVA
ncbi:hypothetical protein [Micromonospora sp. CA-248212]|uniref:hypothetical protein n=1 Tax=Micromonospora sp. CA-248212 TaxID=3239961 RepID=UPI003D8C6003